MTDKTELLIDAKAIQFELLSLAPRLSEPFASNVRDCIERAGKIVQFFEDGEGDENE